MRGLISLAIGLLFRPEFGKRRLFHRIAGMNIEVRPTEFEASSELPQARSKPRSTQDRAIDAAVTTA